MTTIGTTVERLITEAENIYKTPDKVDERSAVTLLDSYFDGLSTEIVDDLKEVIRDARASKQFKRAIQ